MIYEGEKLKTKLQDFKNALLKYSEENKESLTNYDNSQVAYVAEEIDNPHEVEEGKYKIPHKFLYDEISKRGENKDIDQILSAIADYKEYDGEISQDNGKKLEELYVDDKNYTFFHNVNYKGDKTTDEITPICENICKNGLTLTTMGNEVGKIDYTTISTKDKIGLIGFMRNWELSNGIVVLKIPKEKIDNNEQVIGSDKGEPLSPTNPGAVLPEYVVGYLSNDGFKNNPNPLEERQARYKNKFSEKTSGDMEK